ncbi:MAG: hypothetical protein H6741_05155 [Alphaproteobacteria bacterium]|nr:hypothetical protein [Alphaproteobacteria bacterium]MCB9792094.1 hypothetical protein [Alphaproteobacteria bacterium]
MTPETRLIGLSLGADICWPAAYEELLRRLDLDITHQGKRLRFEVERVTVEPFNLRYTPRYDLVLDRLTHWYPVSREWVKKITLMDGVYVLNNPWAIQSMEKHTSYCAMMRLGLPIPETWMIPAKDYDRGEWDTGVVVDRYNKLFDLGKVGEAVGYPAFLKPYDGGGWVGVRRVTDSDSLHAAYDESGKRVNHLQAGVPDWDVFVRGIGMGPQVNVIRYDPDAPLHARYVVDFHYLDGPQWARAQKVTRTINAFFGWDFNSCEMLRSHGELIPIDYANACPDSQVTSLHYHFPWLVKAMLRWSLFCAATKRPMRLNLDWQPFFEVADSERSFEEKLDAYDAIAHERFDTAAFNAFCEEHLAHLDEVALDFFGTDRFRDIVREKVSALYPRHEIEPFTDHFYGLIQFWRKTESDRMAMSQGAQ